MSDEGLKRLASVGVTSPNPVISTTGRVVIDTQQHRITYIGDDFEERALGFDPKLAAQRANPFALERIRYYEFRADGTLMLSTKYETGKEAAAKNRVSQHFRPSQQGLASQRERSNCYAILRFKKMLTAIKLL